MQVGNAEFFRTVPMLESSRFFSSFRFFRHPTSASGEQDVKSSV